MAIAPPTAPPTLLTYEEYMREEPTPSRYDIVDGVKLLANPTRSHNEILVVLLEFFRSFQRAFGQGKTLLSPCDIFIRRSPLRIRQPDLSFISNERLEQLPPPTDPAPLHIAPELVVEILSPNERLALRNEKLMDYCAAGVRECWVIHPVRQFIEVLRMSPDGYEQAAEYQRGETARSIEFPDLAVEVSPVFAP